MYNKKLFELFECEMKARIYFLESELNILYSYYIKYVDGERCERGGAGPPLERPGEGPQGSSPAHQEHYIVHICCIYM